MRQGYYDGQIVQLTKRHQQRRRKRKGADERAVLAEQHLPDPGTQSFHMSLASDQGAVSKHTRSCAR